MLILHKVSLIPAFTPIYQTNGYYVSALYCLSSYVTVIQFLGHTLMAVNRFTLIWFPLNHQTIWARQWYTIIVLFLPFLNICWRIHQPVILDIKPDNTIYTKFSDPETLSLISTILTFIYLITTFLAAIFNVLSFFKYRFRKQTNTSSSQNAVESSLLFLTCISFVAQLLRTSYTIREVLFPTHTASKAIFQVALPIFNDIFALSGSISLLILSSTTRNEYGKFYFAKQQTKPKLTTTATNMTYHK